MAIIITQVAPKDWETYKMIQLEALKQEPQAFGSSYGIWVKATDEKWQERPRNPDSIIFVAKDGESNVGLIGTHFDGTIAEVWGMYVHKNYRGQGVGKLLMQNLLDAIRSNPRHVKKISLMVNPQQESAVRLYKLVGFNKIGTKEYVLGDGKQYELDIMEQDL